MDQRGNANGQGVPDECVNLACQGHAYADGLVDPLDVGYVLSRFRDCV